MEYPNNLRRLRDAQKLSQGQVAESLGINQAEYSRIEKGRRRVGTHLAGLAQILKCDEDDILAPDQYQPASHMLSDDIPVYALPESDGESVRFDMAMTSRIDRPPVLAKAKAAFGMFNCGSAMEPRLRHGDFLFCDPDEPIKDNDIVVLTIERGNRLVAIVREFVGNGVYLRPELSEEQTFGKELKGVAPVISINLAR